MTLLQRQKKHNRHRHNFYRKKVCNQQYYKDLQMIYNKAIERNNFMAALKAKEMQIKMDDKEYDEMGNFLSLSQMSEDVLIRYIKELIKDFPYAKDSETKDFEHNN